MSYDISSLPDDIDSLKEIIKSQSQVINSYKVSYCKLEEAHHRISTEYHDILGRYKVLEGDMVDLQKRYELLEEELRRFMALLYKGGKSEKLRAVTREQLYLFNEAEAIESGDSGDSKNEVVIGQHTRRHGGGRKPLPASLPREEVIHDLSEEEKVCGCGARMSRIGSESTERLDVVPARVRVIRHIRYKYACKECEGVDNDGGGVVRIAPPPSEIIPQGIATGGLLAHIVVSKYADALPLYRQEKIFARLGVELSRKTMASWMVQVGRRCGKLVNLMGEEVLKGRVINMDETPVQVLNEPGRAATSKSYMWVFRGGESERPVLIFRYEVTRSGKFLQDMLKGYKGYIQSDGYKGYDMIGAMPGIEHVGCWAHVRRKFVEVVQARKRKGKKRGYADRVLEEIGRLYAIEHEADRKKLSEEDRHRLRQERAGPVLEGLRKLLDDIYPRTPPEGLLGKAISYTLRQWDRLTRYIENGFLRPDNNLAENAIRPFVVGRKNWLFSAYPCGAEASATLYSLVETAKANGLEPYRYLRYLFEHLPQAETDEDWRALLPMYVDKEHINGMTF